MKRGLVVCALWQEPWTTRADAAKAEYDEQMAAFRAANPQLKPKAAPRQRSSKPKAEGGGSSGGGGGGGGGALAKVVEQLQNVTAEKAELEAKLAKCRKVLGKCAAKRAALEGEGAAEGTGEDAPEGAASMREKIDLLESATNTEMATLSDEVRAARRTR